MTSNLTPSISRSNAPGIRLLRQILRNRSAQFGGILLILLVFASYAAPLFTDKDPNKTAPSVALQPPSLEYPMGTDNIGRDNFTRFLYGGRLSLRVGLAGITIGALIGITLGLTSGYFGGWVDAIISWFTDVLMAFPDILLALAIIAILGPGITNAMLAIGFAFVPSFMRLTRSSVLSLREMTYIEAAKALGSSDARILVKHILPNSIRTLLVLITLGIGSSILAGAALNFLGLGAEPPTAEWGAMLNAGMKFVRQAWWLTFFPGLGIFLAVLSINLIGDAVSDAVAGTTILSEKK
ncbi:MAG: ABC transporter permease [Anaerolineales bacterium]|nr:ABC transporter permease [Anaerolineales bacterium]